MKIKNIFSFLLVLCCVTSLVYTVAVCDLETLKLELLQDLEDNNMLDCLRIIDPPHNFQETEEQSNLRIAAQWDSSCAFEADSLWFDNLKQIYGVSTLVDSEGEPVKEDFPDQADMCELIRAAVAKNLFNIHNLEMHRLPKDFVDRIQCSGPKGDRYGPQICAATSGSYFSSSGWNIFNKSSAILFDNKPQFTDKDQGPSEDDKNPWADNPDDPETVNDLNLLSKDQLENSGGDLAKAINNALQGKRPQKKGPHDDKNEEYDGDYNKESSAKVHHFFKRVETAPLNPHKEFRMVNTAELRFVAEKNKILFGGYMASYKSREFGETCLKLTLNDMEVQESRACISGVRNSFITGAFAQKYSGSQTKIAVQSKTTTQGDIESNGEDGNLSFGAITFPNLGIFEYKLTLDSLNFPVTNRLFTTLENFNLMIKHNSHKPSIYIIILNFGVKLPSGSIAGSLININEIDLIDTTVTRGRVADASLNSMTAVEIAKDTRVSMKYMYKGSKNIEITAEQNDRFNQSITAFKLPGRSKLQNFKPKSSVSLASNSWMSFNINAALQIQKETHVMIIYHCHIRVNRAPFSLRLKMNGNNSFKSTLGHVEDEEFASIQGYIIKKFKPGNYEFDLEFFTNSRETFDPASEQINKQTVTIKIIQFP